jgi:transposase
MNRSIFETWVDTRLAPTLAKGDVVIINNLPAHRSRAAEDAVRARVAWLLFLPTYSPDRNSIVMAFSKLEAHLRAKAARTIDDLWHGISNVCDLLNARCSKRVGKAGRRRPVGGEGSGAARAKRALR